MTYDFSEAEVNALLQIMDAGVRATGLQHAANAAFLAQKLRTPFQAAAAAAAVPNETAEAEAA
jgi:hypothetical protein